MLVYEKILASAIISGCLEHEARAHDVAGEYDRAKRVSFDFVSQAPCAGVA
jgi:hypothetical protein